MAGPIKFELESTAILSSSTEENRSKSKEDKNQGFIFDEAFTSSNTGRLSPSQEKTELERNSSNPSNDLEQSELSQNHEELFENIKEVKMLTRRKRAQPC